MNHQLDALNFDNRFVAELPCDPDSSNRRRQVAGACYSKVLPTKVCKPQVISYSKEVAQLFDLSDEDCTSDYFAQVFAGNLQVRDGPLCNVLWRPSVWPMGRAVGRWQSHQLG